MARSPAVSGMSEFVRMLERRCESRGAAFEKADRWFPSSQRCRALGAVTLARRDWRCAPCGAEHDREPGFGRQFVGDKTWRLRRTGRLRSSGGDRRSVNRRSPDDGSFAQAAISRDYCRHNGPESACFALHAASMRGKRIFPQTSEFGFSVMSLSMISRIAGTREAMIVAPSLS